jgi:predicted dehydrogenase
MNDSVLKLGVVGLDGHGPVFTDVVNGSASMLPGARVVAAMPVPTVMIPKDALAQNVEKTRALGVEIVEDPAQLAKMVEGILILHDDGSQHLKLASRFAGMGKPIFVDKPFEASVEAARQLVAVCRAAGCPVFSASSLRFSAEMRACLADAEAGAVRSAITYSPFNPKPTMPGWIYYGVHAVEPLFTLMGAGCQEVRCIRSDQGPVAVGTWQDGRLGIAKGTIGGKHGYGFTAWREGATISATVDTSRIYPALLQEIKRFIETGEAPVDPEESVEGIAFLVAANESMAQDGAPVQVSR